MGAPARFLPVRLLIVTAYDDHYRAGNLPECPSARAIDRRQASQRMTV